MPPDLSQVILLLNVSWTSTGCGLASVGPSLVDDFQNVSSVDYSKQRSATSIAGKKAWDVSNRECKENVRQLVWWWKCIDFSFPSKTLHSLIQLCLGEGGSPDQAGREEAWKHYQVALKILESKENVRIIINYLSILNEILLNMQRMVCVHLAI